MTMYKLSINDGASIVFDEYSDAFDTFSTLLLAKSIEHVYPKKENGATDYSAEPVTQFLPIRLRLETYEK
jgi:hypothetical protein